jgi:hypothetical protein
MIGPRRSRPISLARGRRPSRLARARPAGTAQPTERGRGGGERDPSASPAFPTPTSRRRSRPIGRFRPANDPPRRAIGSPRSGQHETSVRESKEVAVEAVERRGSSAPLRWRGEARRKGALPRVARERRGSFGGGKNGAELGAR